ncbi:MAG TPA: ABC transporter permease [Acidimicrobiia bacterium]|nr:ABC transporter permease [Acidimicrobiia bacterium]
MITAWHLVVADLRSRFALIAAATLLVSTPLAGYLLLHGFSRGLDRDFVQEASSDLIVQEANSVGEITGSRISPTVEQDLLDRGASFAIPEIHSVAGSSAENAVLIRGVDRDRYRAVTRFTMEAGRPLGADDEPDAVMLGVDLAAKRGAAPGDTVDLRGRPHRVVGVFRVGTYADNEAWLTITGAQLLLGWDDEVSLFIIPGDGPLAEGDTLPGPLAVARRGDFVGLTDEWDPIFDLANVANVALAAASAIILAVILWRLAWLRRRELAVLRAIGMARTLPVLYLGIQGLLIAAVGLIGGIAGSRVMAAVVRIDAFGLTARAVFDGTGLIRAIGFSGAIALMAVTAASLRTLAARPADQLRSA